MGLFGAAVAIKGLFAQKAGERSRRCTRVPSRAKPSADHLWSIPSDTHKSLHKTGLVRLSSVSRNGDAIMVNAAALTCKNPNCARPIPLPPAKRPDKFQHQQLWPTDGAPRNFLCPSCKHVYEYSAQDVHLVSFDETAPEQVREPRNVVCIELPCGASDCESRLRIRTLMAGDEDPGEEAHNFLVLSTFHDVPCGQGHRWSGTYKAGQFRAYVDPEWQT